MCLKIFLMMNPLLYKTSLKDLIIQKSGKGNSMVIVGRQDYIEKISSILSDQKKFTIVNLKYDT